MTSDARFSVVIPAYERASTVDATLASVRRAADEHDRGGDGTTEIIVVDDGSVDPTGPLARAVAGSDPRVQVLRQPNSGVSAARNLGAAHATGRWLVFLDCDDEVDPRWLVELGRALDHGARLAFASAHAIGPDGRDRPWVPVPLGPAFEDVTGLFNPGMFAVERSAFSAVGGYAPALRYSENTDLGMRLTGHLGSNGPVRTATVDRPLMTVVIPDAHGSNANTPRARLESAMYLLDVHEQRLARDRDLHARYWAIAGVAAARLDRTRLAQRCFVRAVRTDPTNLRHLGRLVVSTVPSLRRRRWPRS